MDLENRLIDIETALAQEQKMLDDLNDVIIEQGKTIDKLVKETAYLLSLIKDDAVKPLSEETPPPHY